MRYLITGGTGTFGRALLDRLLTKRNTSEVRIFSRDEAKQFDMQLAIKDKRVRYFLGDVRDRDSIVTAMSDVHYVFHAAALKHVHSCEAFPLEAIKTNTIGTANVIDVAIQAGVKKFILLSSDKAVYPVGVMGATKFLAERVMMAKSINSGKTVLCGVRFGNLINSRGSVLGVWREQIKNGEPCTITHQDATRFIMTLDMAMDLVEYMITDGTNGQMEIYQAKACNLLDLYRAATEDKHKCVKVGLRLGEKMHEYLNEELSSDKVVRMSVEEIKTMLP